MMSVLLIVPAFNLFDATLAPLALAANHGPLSVPTVIALISSFFFGALIACKISLHVGVPSIFGVLILGVCINLELINEYLSPTMVEVLQSSSLALLLFYAGLSTSFSKLKGLVGFGLLLAVGGVIVSSLMFGSLIWLIAVSLHYFLPSLPALPLSVCFLVAACLGSTDASATMNVLGRVSGLVPQRVKCVLEFESSLNDPAAILFLSATTGVFIAMQEPNMMPLTLIAEQFQSFLRNVGSGILCGLILTYIAQYVLKGVLISRDQVLVLGMSIAMAAYGFTTLFGGSGFIAAFVTGCFLSNNIYDNPYLTKELIEHSLEPFSALMELMVFLLFGMLFDPSLLVLYWLPGLLAALVLMLLVRPISVILFRRFSPLTNRENALVCWCGLRGAVPLALVYIVLTELKSVTGLAGEELVVVQEYFQALVFMIVVLNLCIQGLTLPRYCQWLGFSPSSND